MRAIDEIQMQWQGIIEEAKEKEVADLRVA